MTPTFHDEAAGVSLYLGDCLKIIPTLAGIEAVVSDPPYGIAYCHGARKNGIKFGTDCQAIIGDDAPFDPSPWVNYPVAVLWGANHYASRLPDSSCWFVWDKRAGVTSNDQADCEMAWTNLPGVARVLTRYWNGAQATEKNEVRVHSNQKPVTLMRWCLDRAKLNVGSLVCDPYMGSGTTALACIATGRRFIGCEIDENHYRTAERRVKQALESTPLFGRPQVTPIVQEDLFQE